MNGCVVCDERGCEFCPGVFVTPIIDRDPGDETTAVTGHRDPGDETEYEVVDHAAPDIPAARPAYVVVHFKFPTVEDANEFLHNIQKFPPHAGHSITT